MGQQASRCDEFRGLTLDVLLQSLAQRELLCFQNEFSDAVGKQLRLYYKPFAETRRLPRNRRFHQ